MGKYEQNCFNLIKSVRTAVFAVICKLIRNVIKKNQMMSKYTKNLYKFISYIYFTTKRKCVIIDISYR